ncbi:dynein regulatory complex protein 9 isoform X1 [Hyla sarda]|uniref:dynein regulatory complex protein 9 isoform X1 n=2 Tax=Hyla sarda TaxID=327740 RepID=UPI0024C298AB|nr:dynein regulatory complex protein 9 isoform X1 [Hyla sarda]XP_056421548.1 dynein regulatory complex protein 9 isoform X1 [Hyla sarda]
MESLPMMEVLRVCTVLEDSLDQLSVLGYIMPVSYQGRNNIVGSEIGKILKNQRQMEGNFEELIGTRADIQLTQPPLLSKLQNLKEQVHETSEKLKMSNVQFTKAVRQSPLTSDNLKKVQADRQFAAEVIADMLTELETSGSFQSLQHAIATEKEKKAHFYNTIEREQEGRKKIKLLQKQLQDVKQEKKVELQSRTELIAHLKDQLQEMKAKTGMEGKYVKKDTELQVSQTQKKCSIGESNLQMELQKIKEKMDEEIRVHVEIENFLRHHQQELEEKLEYWMEKYDKDTEEKQAELNALKTSRTNDLLLLSDLTKQYEEYETVITEDRLEKEKAQQKKKQEKMELESTIKIQAWWRGTMVRKNLGPYAKTKSKKGKDTGKKGKAKKGGKKK